jgi:uncharacterized membrane protein (DUF4010 family)
VILPLVPNRNLGPFGAFNPFSLWQMVVLISGLGFVGYIAIRIFGARAGILLTSLLGGLASSTASTLAFSRRSKTEPNLSSHYALAVVVACTVMLPRVLILIGVVNRQLAYSLTAPLGLMALPGVAFSIWGGVHERLRQSGAGNDIPHLRNPLSLSAALKFSGLYALISFLVKAAKPMGWTHGLLPLSFVSGLTDVDAISLSLAHGLEGTSPQVASHAVVLAVVSNTLVKTAIAIAVGSKGVKTRATIILGTTAAIGTAWLFLLAGGGLER